MLVHTVYFWLRPDLSEAQRAEFRRGAEELAGIKVVENLHIGTPAATAARPIIDHSFSLAMTLVVKDVAAHDAYQTDPIHRVFVEKFKTFWTRVQIYDAA
jgi:hypothetical protein